MGAVGARMHVGGALAGRGLTMGASGCAGSATAMPSLMTLRACCSASHERPCRCAIWESGIIAAAPLRGGGGGGRSGSPPA